MVVRSTIKQKQTTCQTTDGATRRKLNYLLTKRQSRTKSVQIVQSRIFQLGISNSTETNVNHLLHLAVLLTNQMELFRLGSQIHFIASAFWHLYIINILYAHFCRRILLEYLLALLQI